MDPLETFHQKITNYSREELEEVLLSLNKEKFPKKYQLLRETLANKVDALNSKTEGEEPSSSFSDSKKTDPLMTLLSVLAVLSASGAFYCLLASAIDLPGKKILLKIGATIKTLF